MVSLLSLHLLMPWGRGVRCEGAFTVGFVLFLLRAAITARVEEEVWVGLIPAGFPSPLRFFAWFTQSVAAFRHAHIFLTCHLLSLWSVQCPPSCSPCDFRRAPLKGLPPQ
eukprot:RCo006039